MRDDNDVMVRNFGTGLWGVSNVSIRVSSLVEQLIVLIL